MHTNETKGIKCIKMRFAVCAIASVFYTQTHTRARARARARTHTLTLTLTHTSARAHTSTHPPHRPPKNQAVFPLLLRGRSTTASHHLSHFRRRTSASLTVSEDWIIRPCWRPLRLERLVDLYLPPAFIPSQHEVEGSSGANLCRFFCSHKPWPFKKLHRLPRVPLGATDDYTGDSLPWLS